MLSLMYMFATNTPPLATVSPHQPSIDCVAPANATNGFTLVFHTAFSNSPDSPVRIAEIPGVTEVMVYQRDRNDGDMRRNYCNFKMPDGTIPVMEATVFLSSIEHPDWKSMTIGFPLACLKDPYGEHEFTLSFTGVRWALYADGELMDLDFPFGYSPWKANATLKIDSTMVRGARLYAPALAMSAEPRKMKLTAPVQYWTPSGFNTWVGDVATGYFNGRYHLFYLLDRRHHASKFGKGAHYFEHLSTADFKTWVEHEAAVPIDEQFECVGTGAPFMADGKLCIAYGLHTERIVPIEKTTLPMQMKQLETTGRTAFVTRDTPGVPIGATYSVSTDGVSAFKKSGKFFHYSRNPSVYGLPDGTFRMLAGNASKGTWESTSLDGDWRCVSADFPPGGDCTFTFRWGADDYVIGGFRDFWTKPASAPINTYQNLAKTGFDCYDGLCVPCVTEVEGGRFILAGWTDDHGWGGHLVLRELIRFADGRIGSRWLKEAVPATGVAKPLTQRREDVPARSFLLTFTVSGRTAVNLRGWTGACRFEIDPATGRAQFAAIKADGTAQRQKVQREATIHGKREFAIENLIGTEQPFVVRLIAKYDPKAGGTMLDAEIAGARTMIGFWSRFSITDIAFDGAATNATLAIIE